MKTAIVLGLVFITVHFNVNSAEKPAGEYFLAAPPKGWALGHKEVRETASHFIFLPAGDDATQWTQMVAISKISANTPAPDQFLSNLAERNTKNCESYQIQRLAFKSANGYDTHGMIELCGKSQTSNQGELSIIRAIKSQDYLFVIQKAWRIQPYDPVAGLPIAKEEIDETILYLGSAKVCDTRKGTCPQNLGQ